VPKRGGRNRNRFTTPPWLNVETGIKPIFKRKGKGTGRSEAQTFNGCCNARNKSPNRRLTVKGTSLWAGKGVWARRASKGFWQSDREGIGENRAGPEEDPTDVQTIFSRGAGVEADEGGVPGNSEKPNGLQPSDTKDRSRVEKSASEPQEEIHLKYLTCQLRRSGGGN